jgi:hypothetical protein
LSTQPIADPDLPFVLGSPLCDVQCGLSGVNALIQTVVVPVPDPDKITGGGFDVNISNVRCGSFCVCNAGITYRNLGVSMDLDGLSLNCQGDFEYKAHIGFPHGKGSVDVTIDKSTFAIAGAISSDATAKAGHAPLKSSMTPGSCKADIHFGNLAFRGGVLSKVAELFKSKIENLVTSKVSSEGCKLLSTLIGKNGTSALDAAYQKLKPYMTADDNGKTDLQRVQSALREKSRRDIEEADAEMDASRQY